MESFFVPEKYKMESYGFPLLSELPNYTSLLELPIQVYQMDDITPILISNTNLLPEI